MNEGAIQTLLDHLFPHGVPASLRPLIHPARAGTLLNEFKLGPILPLGADRAPRLAISDEGEPTQWEHHLKQQWPHPRLSRFLGRVPPGTRRMLDTDGSEHAVVYLDDLQDVDTTDLRGPTGPPLLCAALAIPSGTHQLVTRHTEPPLSDLYPPYDNALRALLAAGAEGLWGIRWGKEGITGLLWVTESRWRHTAEQTHAIATSLGSHPIYTALREQLAPQGITVYPDALEARQDGSWDLTLGFLTP